MTARLKRWCHCLLHGHAAITAFDDHSNELLACECGKVFAGPGVTNPNKVEAVHRNAPDGELIVELRQRLNAI